MIVSYLIGADTIYKYTCTREALLEKWEHRGPIEVRFLGVLLNGINNIKY